jgi:hypothetical protein
MKSGRPQADSFEDRERRGYAMSVLDSPDQLMMYAQSTGDVSSPILEWPYGNPGRLHL